MFPASASAWLASRRGAALDVTPLASSQGQVWRVDVPRGGSLVVKCGPVSAIDREVWGLQAAATGVPAVIARPDRTVLVLEWRPGKPAETPASMHAAGAWLRDFHHHGAPDDDHLDLAEALRRRRDAWLSRANANLDVSAIASLDFEAFAGEARVPCHRDFTPSNWLWDDAAGLTVVDFAQARADVRLWDLAKLEGETFRRRPDLRGRFYEGYGPLADHDAGRLRTLVLLHGLQTAVWGDRHQDEAFSRLGREILGA